jgi:hypothetical protein
LRILLLKRYESQSSWFPQLAYDLAWLAETRKHGWAHQPRLRALSSQGRLRPVLKNPFLLDLLTLSHDLRRRPRDFKTANLLAGLHFPQPNRGHDELTARGYLLFRLRIGEEPMAPLSASPLSGVAAWRIGVCWT